MIMGQQFMVRAGFIKKVPSMPACEHCHQLQRATTPGISFREEIIQALAMAASAISQIKSNRMN
jgi:hypothetical protein